MNEEMEQLEKNKTWPLIPQDQVELTHRLLDGKWVYKIKRGPNNEITRFKPSWVIDDY